jgi:hypothetical protein
MAVSLPAVLCHPGSSFVEIVENGNARANSRLGKKRTECSGFLSEGAQELGFRHAVTKTARVRTAVNLRLYTVAALLMRAQFLCAAAVEATAHYALKDHCPALWRGFL